MTRGPRTVLALVAAMLALPATRAWDQCSMCQSVVSQSPEVQAAAAQLNLAILVLFFAPYLLLASFAFLLFPGPVKHLFRIAVGRLSPR